MVHEKDAVQFQGGKGRSIFGRIPCSSEKLQSKFTKKGASYSSI
jgi:hypothetical protein